jgi:hypothetical protein
MESNTEKTTQLGSLTMGERESLRIYLMALSQMIRDRHRKGTPEEVEMAFLDLQDYLTNISINDANDGMDIDWIIE